MAGGGTEFLPYRLPGAAAVLRITSGRRTRGTAPAQLQESDQEDELPPARRFVDR